MTDISVPIKEENEKELDEEDNNEWKNSVGLNRKRALDPRKIEVLRGGMKRAFEFSLLGRPERCAIKQGLAAIESLQQVFNLKFLKIN